MLAKAYHFVPNIVKFFRFSLKIQHLFPKQLPQTSKIMKDPTHPEMDHSDSFLWIVVHRKRKTSISVCIKQSSVVLLYLPKAVFWNSWTITIGLREPEPRFKKKRFPWKLFHLPGSWNALKCSRRTCYQIDSSSKHKPSYQGFACPKINYVKQTFN